MRKVFIEVSTRRAAIKAAPWAAAIVKCDGGYIAFESASDFRAWKNQR